MNLFLLLLRSSWKVCLLSVAFGAVSGPATMVMIYLVHQSLTDPGKSSPWLAMKFILACCAVLATQISSKHLLVRLSQRTSAKLQLDLCVRILDTPLDKLESIGRPTLLANLRHNVATITGAFVEFPTICASTIIVVSGVVYLTYLSPLLAMAALTFVAIVTLVYSAGVRWANYHMFQAKKEQENIFNQLHAFVFGIKELKGNNRRCTEFVFDVLLPADTGMRLRMMKGMQILGVASSWGRLALFAGIGLMVFTWQRFWPEPREVLTVYTFTVFYLTSPLDSILSWVPMMTRARIALQRLERLGLMFNTSDSATVSYEPTAFESIELRGVEYHYPAASEEFQLGPLNLTLAPGEVVFIAGGNGCGKTTLAKLLTGLYTPHAGKVLWDGAEVDTTSIGNYRQLFATVFVEGHLFDRLLGVEVNQKELARWTQRLGVQDKVEIESGRFSTDQLSRGQHKRLALLVALLDDRPVFVFDEWAAEQDPGFKEIFYRELVPELKSQGRTVVAITHDDRFFSTADRVVKVVDGTLEESGKKAA